MKGFLILAVFAVAVVAVPAKTVKKQLMDTVLERPPLAGAEAQDSEGITKVEEEKPMIEKMPGVQKPQEAEVKKGLANVEETKPTDEKKLQVQIKENAKMKQGVPKRKEAQPVVQKKPKNKKKEKTNIKKLVPKAGDIKSSVETQQEKQKTRVVKGTSNVEIKPIEEKKPRAQKKEKTNVKRGVSKVENAKPSVQKTPQNPMKKKNQIKSNGQPMKSKKQKAVESADFDDIADEEDSDDLESEEETIEADDCHPRICSRMYIPVCAMIDGKKMTAPSPCEFSNRVLCARMSRRSGRRASVIRFLHNGRCN